MNKIDTKAVAYDNFGVYEFLPYIVLNAHAVARDRTFSVALNNITCYDLPKQRQIPLRAEAGMQEMTWCHHHERLEFFCVRSGEAEIYTEDARFSCGAGDIVLINSWEAHGVDVPKGRPLDYSVFGIPLALFSEGGVYDYVSNLKLSGKRFRSYYPACHPLSARLRSYLEDAVNAAGKSAPGWEYELKGALLRAVGLLLAENMIENRTERSTDSLCFMENVAHYLESHFSEDIGLSSIAETLNYSREHFCRLFRQTYGLTFHEYLNYYRVTLAKDILRKENHPDITKLSTMLGYNNTTYFSRVFHKICGMSPSAFASAERARQHRPEA